MKALTVGTTTLTDQIQFHIDKGAQAFIAAIAASKALDKLEADSRTRIDGASGDALVGLAFVAIAMGGTREAKTAFLKTLTDGGVPMWRAKRMRAAAFDKNWQAVLTKGAKPSGDISRPKAIANAKAANAHGIMAVADFRTAHKNGGEKPEPIGLANSTHYMVALAVNLLAMECKKHDFEPVHPGPMLRALRRAVAAADPSATETAPAPAAVDPTTVSKAA